MYKEVPQVVSLFEQECSNCTAKPKSPSLTSPLSDMNRLSGLMSYSLTLLPFAHSVNHLEIVEVIQSQ